MQAGRQLSFRTTETDERVLAAISGTKYGGLSYAALLRLALKVLAESVGAAWEMPQEGEHESR